MGYVVKMPKLGLEMEQGTLLEWFAEEGTAVEKGETIAEVESEKSIGEVDAREDGVLRLIGLEEGETVPPGTPIGIVAGADEDITDLEAEFETEASSEVAEAEADEDETVEASSKSAGAQTDAGENVSATESTDVKASPKAKRRADELDVDITGVDGSGPQGAITADDVEAAADTETDAEPTKQVRASPRAEHRADELGVDLTGVDGSGPQGAITADDVENAAEAASAEAPPEASATGTTGTERSAMTSEENYHTTTYVTHGEEADALIKTTEMAANAFEFDVSVNDVLLLVISSALDDHPKFNATFEDETHHLHDHQDIAIGIQESEGDPTESVISNVDDRTFTDFVTAAHDHKDLEDNDEHPDNHPTFAFANEEDCEDVRSIVTPPTVAGLVANYSYRRAIPGENGVELRRYLRLSLAYDSRAIGDRDADAFLERLLEYVEEAPELVLRTYQ